MRIKMLIAFLLIIIGSATWFVVRLKKQDIRCFESYCENKGLVTSKNCAKLECLNNSKKRTCDSQSGSFDYFAYVSDETTVEIPICRLDDHTFVELAILKGNTSKSQ